jgi:hypothetical protein
MYLFVSFIIINKRNFKNVGGSYYQGCEIAAFYAGWLFPANIQNKSISIFQLFQYQVSIYLNYYYLLNVVHARSSVNSSILSSVVVLQ